ncbi:MAG: hypothetical protein WDN26_04685 [Chitinophagaceae bacterium]
MKRFTTGLLLTGILSLFIMNANSQVIKTYEKEWKKVEDFVKKNLPQSALTEVKNIYTLAKKKARMPRSSNH